MKRGLKDLLCHYLFYLSTNLYLCLFFFNVPFCLCLNSQEFVELLPVSVLFSLISLYLRNQDRKSHLDYLNCVANSEHPLLLYFFNPVLEVLFPFYSFSISTNKLLQKIYNLKQILIKMLTVF